MVTPTAVRGPAATTAHCHPASDVADRAINKCRRHHIEERRWAAPRARRSSPPAHRRRVRGSRSWNGKKHGTAVKCQPGPSRGRGKDPYPSSSCERRALAAECGVPRTERFSNSGRTATAEAGEVGGGHGCRTTSEDPARKGPSSVRSRRQRRAGLDGRRRKPELVEQLGVVRAQTQVLPCGWVVGVRAETSRAATTTGRSRPSSSVGVA